MTGSRVPPARCSGRLATCCHGGAFFEAIGDEFDTLARVRGAARSRVSSGAMSGDAHVTPGGEGRCNERQDGGHAA